MQIYNFKDHIALFFLIYIPIDTNDYEVLLACNYIKLNLNLLFFMPHLKYIIY